MNDLAFPYSEQLFCEATGLSRTDIKFCRDRHLREDRDWIKDGGREIRLSSSGIKKLWRALKAKPAAFDLSACIAKSKKNGADALMLGAPRKFKVAQIPLNPRMVRATDEHGRYELVEVGSNANFATGDEIDVRPHESQVGLWRLLSAVPAHRRRPSESAFRSSMEFARQAEQRRRDE